MHAQLWRAAMQGLLAGACEPCPRAFAMPVPLCSPPGVHREQALIDDAKKRLEDR